MPTPDRTGVGSPRRCRCGHFPTDHLEVAPIPGGASFQLASTAACRRCGAATCRKFEPVPS